MPYLQSRVFVSLCPFVNLDLFKRGYYHISCKLTYSQHLARVDCMDVRDMFGALLGDHCFPGACMIGNEKFITQTVLIEYADQYYSLGECFLFSLKVPIVSEYTEAYVPAKFSLVLDLMFSGNEEMPTDPNLFERVSSRTLSLTVDWRKGLHDFWPVMFDYFHMASVGVRVHASLCGLSPDQVQSVTLPPSSRRWPFQRPSSPPALISYSKMLFGSAPTRVNRIAIYEVPLEQISRAKQVHQMLTAIIESARDSLRAGFAVMSEDFNPPAAQAASLGATSTNLDEVEEECRIHLEAMTHQLMATWEWFCQSSVVHPDMVTFLLKRTHETRFRLLQRSLVWPDSAHANRPVNQESPLWITSTATTVRKTLIPALPLYCVENVETPNNASILFFDPCPWVVRRRAQLTFQNSRYDFMRRIPSVVLSPSARRSCARSDDLHLVVCVHGLQGNQFDLRLYRIYLEMCLPGYRFEFLMSQNNQADTFCDFNLMTDRLQDEVLDHLKDRRLPTKISFFTASLGAIIVRNLLTRPGMTHLLSRLYLFLTICGPHLGTQHQTGVVSAGMWFLRKYYQSQSLLQLSMKDAQDPKDSFLYHLNECPTFEHFCHVVLVSSTQDKYVPFQSAKLMRCGSHSDDTVLKQVMDSMCTNVLRKMERAGVNMVRVTVQHSLPTSTDSVIGRAAHIAMLDNELFVEKFATCHLVQYFLST